MEICSSITNLVYVLYLLSLLMKKGEVSGIKEEKGEVTKGWRVLVPQAKENVLPIFDACSVDFLPKHYTFNILPEIIENCKAVADEYVECEVMILIIDLILHKPKAYRHLFYNISGKETITVESLLWKSVFIYLIFDVSALDIMWVLSANEMERLGPVSVASSNRNSERINAIKGEEESGEAARRWRLQKEAEINAAFDDSIAAAINRLGVPHKGYRVFGSRPEIHDPSIPWKQHVRTPAPFRLPTDLQPSPEDIKQWKKTQLMRYFVKLIRESTIFDRCKTLSEAANEFTARLEKWNLPLQLAMLSKHRKGDRITHPEDWILSYDKSYEGMSIYQN
ncbi:hypothetical protein OROMI_001227 [Orobanche minor]